MAPFAQQHQKEVPGSGDLCVSESKDDGFHVITVACFLQVIVLLISLKSRRELLSK